MLTDADLWSIRQNAADRGDCDLSRLCSLPLWGKSTSQRRRANKAVAVFVATEGM